LTPATVRLPEWDSSAAFAAELFVRLRAATSIDGRITRPSYGVGEQAAHDLIRDAGIGLGMEPSVDAAGNLRLRLTGGEPDAPGWMTGSHMDAVPHGGNFDGAAGVIAGLAAVHAYRRAGMRPPRNIDVVAFRAEEGSSWFNGQHKSHFGSRALLGQLDERELRAARSVQDQASLHDCIARAGFNPERIAVGRPFVDPRAVLGFIELHIEQGPILVSRAIALGVVRGIRGTLRVRNAVCIGAYAHSGAVPQGERQDAVFAAAQFAVELERTVMGWLDAGRDVVCALGRFGTDPAQHGLTKVPGELRFTVDLRSLDADLLREASLLLPALAERIGAARGVTIQLGPLDLAPPAPMDAGLTNVLAQVARALTFDALPMASGAGHDAANFSAAGVPAAMIFVRNDHGSHNPHEAMDMDDFSRGARLLAEVLLRPGIE
jgi:N-carbamoyl-L-amino-acid hydrolase